MAAESPVRVAVHGACGRMGQRLVHAIAADPQLKLAAAVVSPKNPRLGEDVGVVCGLGPLGVPITHDLPRHIDGVIDFSAPHAALELAKTCAGREVPLVVATTGFTAQERAELEAMHHTMPLLVAANCSLVVNILMKLTGMTAEILKGRDFDVEIVERHHRYKADAPSGTALQFAAVVEKAMGQQSRRHGREGVTGARPRGEIGLHAVRAGDNVGEHTVIFSTIGETLELVHRGHSRDSYVMGALAAVKFLVTRKAGLYTMADVLGL